MLDHDATLTASIFFSYAQDCDMDTLSFTICSVWIPYTFLDSQLLSAGIPLTHELGYLSTTEIIILSSYSHNSSASEGPEHNYKQYARHSISVQPRAQEGNMLDYVKVNVNGHHAQVTYIFTLTIIMVL